MRKYTLASPNARAEVDLREHCIEIESAVHEVIPEAEVTIYPDYYTVSPSPEKGDAIRIGRRISKTVLGHYCVQIPKLFNGQELEE